jgi:hypothetical protein
MKTDKTVSFPSQKDIARQLRPELDPIEADALAGAVYDSLRRINLPVPNDQAMRQERDAFGRALEDSLSYEDYTRLIRVAATKEGFAEKLLTETQVNTYNHRANGHNSFLVAAAGVTGVLKGIAGWGAITTLLFARRAFIPFFAAWLVGTLVKMALEEGAKFRTDKAKERLEINGKARDLARISAVEILNRAAALPARPSVEAILRDEPDNVMTPKMR